MGNAVDKFRQTIRTQMRPIRRARLPRCAPRRYRRPNTGPTYEGHPVARTSPLRHDLPFAGSLQQRMDQSSSRPSASWRVRSSGICRGASDSPKATGVAIHPKVVTMARPPVHKARRRRVTEAPITRKSDRT